MKVPVCGVPCGVAEAVLCSQYRSLSAPQTEGVGGKWWVKGNVVVTGTKHFVFHSGSRVAVRAGR